MKILFVDDEKDVLIVGKLLIRSLGHEAFLADSGENAVSFMKSNDILGIDIIFLDLMMPGMNGFDVLKFMKHAKIKIPTILQTGMESDSDFKKAKVLGAAGYMRKPYSRQDMEYFINKYVANVRSSTE